MKQSCGRCIKVAYQGRTIVASVQDTCPGCAALGRIDLSQGAYQALGASLGAGVVDVTWDWVNCANGQRQTEADPQTDGGNGGGLPTVAIVFIALGCALLVVGLIVAGIFVYRRNNRPETP